MDNFAVSLVLQGDGIVTPAFTPDHQTKKPDCLLEEGDQTMNGK